MKHSLIERVLLYTIGLLLFLEWLYPLDALFTSIHVKLFVYYAIFCFLITVLQLSWWLSPLLKAIGLVFAYNFTFSMSHLYSVMPLYEEVKGNVLLIFQSKWHLITDEFENVLFLILIWLVSYLVYYWYIVLKNNLLFLIFTFVYVTILDTFTVYDGSYAIIRIFVLALISYSVVRLYKTWKDEDPKIRRRYLFLLTTIITLAVAVGYFLPKGEAEWPDPVPFATEFNQNKQEMREEDVKKSGYGTNDEQLGGPFEFDDETVFTVQADDGQYWKMETKDVYTGKGWERSEEVVFEKRANDALNLADFAAEIESEEVKEATFSYEGPFATMDVFAYPYGVKEVHYPESDFTLVNENSGLLKRRGADDQVTSYMMNYKEPLFYEETLSESNLPQDESFKEMYTQLPDDLPGRVSSLADEIVSDVAAETQLEQTEAIEHYFSSSEFVYETKDVEVPEADEDYVDQFLFETKKGYCDNYSTSMVVLLRSLDIPARWVKGFTGGDVQHDVDDGYVFEVKNEHAHSWVEVYFEGHGWIPFEPTKGFNNHTTIIPEEALDEEASDESENVEFEETDLDEETEQTEDEQSENEEAVSNEKIGKVIGAILISLVIIGLILLFVKRLEIRRKLLYKKMMNEKSVQSFERAYHFLLHVIEKQGYEKETSMTLRNYAKEVDRIYNTEQMKFLTTFYEQILYNKESPNQLDEEMILKWNEFITKVMKTGIRGR